MKRYIKLAALLLAAVLLFASCSRMPAVGPDGNETSAEEVSGPEVSEESPADIEIVKDGSCIFKMATDKESYPLVTDCEALIEAINDATGAQMALAKDVSSVKDAPVILVGACGQEDAERFIASLPENSYGFRADGNRLIIAGKDDSLTALACREFERTVIRSEEMTSGGGMSVPEGFERIVTLDAPFSEKELLGPDFTAAAVVERRGSIPVRDGFKYTQGAATDGKYWYMTLYRKVGGVENVMLVKKDIATGEEAAVSDVLPLGHANGMCYDSLRNRLVVTNMEGKTLTFVDPETLTVIGTEDVSVPGTPYAITYNASKDCFVIAASGKLHITDGDFKVKTEFYMVIDGRYATQDLDSDDDYIFMNMSPIKGKASNNIVVVYSWETGYIKTVQMKAPWESESLMNFGGNRYATFNTGGVMIADLRFVAVYAREGK